MKNSAEMANTSYDKASSHFVVSSPVVVRDFTSSQSISIGDKGERSQQEQKKEHQSNEPEETTRQTSKHFHNMNSSKAYPPCPQSPTTSACTSPADKLIRLLKEQSISTTPKRKRNQEHERERYQVVDNGSAKIGAGVGVSGPGAITVSLSTSVSNNSMRSLSSTWTSNRSRSTALIQKTSSSSYYSSSSSSSSSSVSSTLSPMVPRRLIPIPTPVSFPFLLEVPSTPSPGPPKKKSHMHKKENVNVADFHDTAESPQDVIITNGSAASPAGGIVMVRSNEDGAIETNGSQHINVSHDVELPGDINGHDIHNRTSPVNVQDDRILQDPKPHRSGIYSGDGRDPEPESEPERGRRMNNGAINMGFPPKYIHVPNLTTSNGGNSSLPRQRDYRPSHSHIRQGRQNSNHSKPPLPPPSSPTTSMMGTISSPPPPPPTHHYHSTSPPLPLPMHLPLPLPLRLFNSDNSYGNGYSSSIDMPYAYADELDWGHAPDLSYVPPLSLSLTSQSRSQSSLQQQYPSVSSSSWQSPPMSQTNAMNSTSSSASTEHGTWAFATTMGARACTPTTITTAPSMTTIENSWRACNTATAAASIEGSDVHDFSFSSEEEEEEEEGEKNPMNLLEKDESSCKYYPSFEMDESSYCYSEACSEEDMDEQSLGGLQFVSASVPSVPAPLPPL